MRERNPWYEKLIGRREVLEDELEHDDENVAPPYLPPGDWTLGRDLEVPPPTIRNVFDLRHYEG